MRAPDERNSSRRDDRLREAIHRTQNEDWIASAYAQGRFGGLQARHSSHSERRRVVAEPVIPAQALLRSSGAPANIRHLHHRPDHAHDVAATAPARDHAHDVAAAGTAGDATAVATGD